MIPAALTRTSRPPKRSTAARTIPAGASGAVMSAAHATARPPAAAIDRTTSAITASWRPTTTIDAPSRPNASAAARPMPLVAPVTTTVFPLNDMAQV